jgi:hypothetical protein
MNIQTSEILPDQVTLVKVIHTPGKIPEKKESAAE